MKQQSDSEAAYSRGQQDNYDGKRRDENPYTGRADLRAAWWGEGWCAAQAERDERADLCGVEAA